MADKPTVEKLKQLYSDWVTYYNQLHKDQKAINKYYELKFKAGIPTKAGYKQITPPSAREWIDVGVRLYTLDNPKVIVWPRGKGDDARAKDAKVEAFCNFWVKRIILQIKDAAKKLPLRGEVFLKPSMDDIYFGNKDYKGIPMEELLSAESSGDKDLIRLKAEYENKRLFHFPLKMDVIDPVNVYASPAHEGLVPRGVIECYNITVSEALDLCQCNDWHWTTTKKSTQLVTWFSYISDEWRCFMIGESKDAKDFKPILEPEVQPNILGFCNYVHPPSGYGNSDYDGKPESLYRSLLSGKEDMFDAESRVLSQIDAIDARFAWWIIKVIGEQEFVEQIYPKGTKITVNPEEVIRETENVKVEILKGESPPPGLFQEFAIITNRAQPPAVLGGGRPIGVPSAQGIEDLIGIGKPIYKTPFKNLEDALGIMVGMGLKIIDTVYKHPVAFKDMSTEGKRELITLKPEDIDGHYDCEVQLLAEPPEATQIRKTQGSNLRRAGDISLETCLTKYHDMSKEEVRHEIARIIAERAVQEPGMREFIVRDAMKMLGMEQALAELDAAMKKAAGKVPPKREPEGEMPTGTESGPRGKGTSSELELTETAHEVEAGGISMGA